MRKAPSPEDPAALLREARRRNFMAFLDRAWPHICGGDLVQRKLAHRRHCLPASAGGKRLVPASAGQSASPQRQVEKRSR